MKTSRRESKELNPGSSRFWMKDSSGYPSVTITFLFVSFWITTFVYCLSIVSKIGQIEIRSFDPGASAAYFGIVFGAYVTRRFTDAKYGNPQIPNQDPTVTNFHEGQ